MSQARLVPHSMGPMVLRTSGHVPHARRTMHTDDAASAIAPRWMAYQLAARFLFSATLSRACICLPHPRFERHEHQLGAVGGL